MALDWARSKGKGDVVGDDYKGITQECQSRQFFILKLKIKRELNNSTGFGGNFSGKMAANTHSNASWLQIEILLIPLLLLYLSGLAVVAQPAVDCGCEGEKKARMCRECDFSQFKNFLLLFLWF